MGNAKDSAMTDHVMGTGTTLLGVRILVQSRHASLACAEASLVMTSESNKGEGQVDREHYNFLNREETGELLPSFQLDSKDV